MGYTLRRRGLGTMILGLPVTIPQTQLPGVCSSSWWKYAMQPECWSYSFDAWGQMAALPPVPNMTAPPHAIPSAYGTGPATVEQAEQETTQVLADAWATQHDNIAAWGSQLPDNPVPDVPCTWLNVPCWLIAAVIGVGALGVFGAVAGGVRRYR